MKCATAGRTNPCRLPILSGIPRWTGRGIFILPISAGTGPTGRLGGREPGGPRYSFWYNFEQRGYPFFAFDARFERLPNGKHIVGRGQMTAFEAWLASVAESETKGRLRPHVPKFVLSGSVFAPGLEEFRREPERARRADNWQGFERDRGELAHHVARSRLQNLVFLIRRLPLPGGGPLRFLGRSRLCHFCPGALCAVPLRQCAAKRHRSKRRFPLRQHPGRRCAVRPGAIPDTRIRAHPCAAQGASCGKAGRLEDRCGAL